MRFLQDISSIRSTLFLVFAIIILLVAGLTAYGIFSVSGLNDLVLKIYDKPLMAVNHARAAHEKFIKAQTAMELALEFTETAGSENTEQITSLVKDAGRDLSIVGERLPENKISEPLLEARHLIAKWQVLGLQLLKPPKEGLSEVPMPESISDAAKKASIAVDRVVQHAAAYGYHVRAASMANMSKTRWNMIAIAIVTMVVTLGMSLVFAMSISRPIRAATAVAERVASGNFSDTIVSTRRDELGRLLRSLADMQVSLCEAARDDQEQIRLKDVRFETAINNMPSGLCMYDGDQRLVICNHNFARMYNIPFNLLTPGTTLRAVLEHRISNGIYAGESPEEYIEERLAWVSRDEPGFKTQTLRDGRTIQISHQPMEENGWVTIHSDITDQKKVEMELIRHRDHLQELVDSATQELNAKADELKSALAKEMELSKLQRQFVSMASHEFRTPLAIIDGAAQRLKRKAGKNQLTSDDAVQRVEKIRGAVKRMTRLMESTLTAARMEEGMIKVDIGPCNIRRTIQEVCERQQDVDREHVISHDLDGLPETIQADAGAVEQVLTNLLSNAVKYSPSAVLIEVTARAQNDHVVISVRDHGLGIDEDDLPKMFGRFFRARTSSGIAGTGIGLSVVKELVEMHGGTVSVMSKKDEGSTFTIRLPVAGPDQEKQADTRVA